MKSYIIALTLLICVSIHAQINNTTKVQKNLSIQKIETDKPVFPIRGSKVAGLPIPIPGPNNTPVILQAANQTNQMIYAASGTEVIKGCDLLHFKGNELKIRIHHSPIPKQRDPVYAGAWLYDNTDKKVDVGYVPATITFGATYTDVLLKFNAFPVTTAYIEVIFIQNGNILIKKNFQAAYQWGKAQSVKTMAKMVEADKPVMANGLISKSGPDLLFKAIKSEDNSGSTSAFEGLCTTGYKSIFISNAGNQVSAVYEVHIGTYKEVGNKKIYTLLEIIKKPPLEPHTETYVSLYVKETVDNLEASIKFPNGSRGEINPDNNTISKKCHLLK